MKTANIKRWIYQPGRLHCQTMTYLDADGVERCAYTSGPTEGNGKEYTVEEYLDFLNDNREFGSPDFIVADWDAVNNYMRAVQDNEIITPWSEITEDDYDEMLNVLPPEKWQTVDGVNIFRMCEYYTDNITQHYAALFGKYFTRKCRTTTPYAVLAAEVKAAYLKSEEKEVIA